MLKEIKTSLLTIAYDEEGLADAPVVLLLHGFPYDAGNWKPVSEALAGKGYRTLAPYHRGYGMTRFHSTATMRSGQYSAMNSDIREFCTSLNLNNVFIIGHDWGATIAYQLGALYPDLVKGIVSLGTQYNGFEHTISALSQIEAYWYQWFFNTPQGYLELRDRRNEFCRRLWSRWSPSLKFNEEEFERTAMSWNNPDFSDIVIHSYRQRWKNAKVDPRYDAQEKQLKRNPSVSVPTIFLHGEEDGANLPESSVGKDIFFNGFYERRLLAQTGHFIQRENPAAVIRAFEEIVAKCRTV